MVEEFEENTEVLEKEKIQTFMVFLTNIGLQNAKEEIKFYLYR